MPTHYALYRHAQSYNAYSKLRTREAFALPIHNFMLKRLGGLDIRELSNEQRCSSDILRYKFRDIGMAPACLMMMSQKDRILHVFLLIILWGQTATASPSTQLPIAGCVTQDGSSNIHSACLKKKVPACLPGFYQPDNCSAELSTCKSCPPGTFTPDFNNCSVCFKCRPPCPPGYRETEPCTHLSDRKCELIPVSSTPMHDLTMEKSPPSVTKDVDGTTTEANILDHGTTKESEQVISSTTEESPSTASPSLADDVPPNTSSTTPHAPKLPPATRDRHRKLDGQEYNQIPRDDADEDRVQQCDQGGPAGDERGEDVAIDVDAQGNNYELPILRHAVHEGDGIPAVDPGSGDASRNCGAGDSRTGAARLVRTNRHSFPPANRAVGDVLFGSHFGAKKSPRKVDKVGMNGHGMHGAMGGVGEEDTETTV